MKTARKTIIYINECAIERMRQDGHGYLNSEKI